MRARTPQVCFLAIGDELLTGEVQDSNLFTLSRRLTHAGFFVREARLIRDNREQIAAQLSVLLAYPPAVIIISGGLGPTDDDRTLDGVSQALDRPLEEHEVARRYVEEQYAALLASGEVRREGPEKARRKMSTLPAGATPLPNPLGTAPGVRLEVEKTLIYCLPGVPDELEAIYENSIAPELQRRFAASSYAESYLVVDCVDEAEVAAPLEAVHDRHPDVYLKSLARAFSDASEEGLRIIATASAAQKAQACSAVERALRDLQRALEEVGIEVLASG